jgi:hypothetical protein
MQKVEGSNPFIRFSKPCKPGGFVVPAVNGARDVARNARCAVEAQRDTSATEFRVTRRESAVASANARLRQREFAMRLGGRA